jgi:hypothetical protein
MFRQKTFLFVMVFVAILAVASVAFAQVGEISLTLNPTATISPSKTILTVSGTVTCPIGHTVTNVSVEAFQQRGNRQLSDSAYAFYYNPETGNEWICTGSPMLWTATLSPYGLIEGLWQPGPVTVLATADSCHLVPDEWGYGMTCESGTGSQFVMDARLHAGQ